MAKKGHCAWGHGAENDTERLQRPSVLQRFLGRLGWRAPDGPGCSPHGGVDFRVRRHPDLPARNFVPQDIERRFLDVGNAGPGNACLYRVLPVWEVPNARFENGNADGV